MLRVGLLLLLGAALSVAMDPCCTSEDRNRVQQQWRDLVSNQDAKMRMNIARLIMLKLVETHPETKPMFKNVGIYDPESGKYQAYCMRLINALDLIINLLKDNEAYEEAVEHLADEHANRPGLKKLYFDTIQDIIVGALPQIMDDFDESSWRACVGTTVARFASKLNN